MGGNLKKGGHTMTAEKMTLEEAYRVMFVNYPDVVKVKDACTMIGVGRKKIYDLIKDGILCTVTSGNGYNITKLSVIAFLLG